MEIRDIPDTLEGLTAWSIVCSCLVFHQVFAQLEDQAYEETYMVPADTNREVAGYTVDELLGFVPETFGMKAFGERTVICLLEDIVRESMSYVPHIFKMPFRHSYFIYFIDTPSSHGSFASSYQVVWA